MPQIKNPVRPNRRPGPVKLPENTRLTRIWERLSQAIKAKRKAHEYVELWEGLKWATCNVGASKPEETGDYFAWEETVPYYSIRNPFVWKNGKEGGYVSESHKYYDRFKKTYTKYINADGRMTIEPVDDAARANWGGNWCMPTRDEFEKLFNQSICSLKETTRQTKDGKTVEGITFTSKVPGYEGNELFFVLTEKLVGTEFHITQQSFYWTSSWYDIASSILDTDANAFSFNLDPAHICMWDLPRHFGSPVRPVSD